MLSAASFPSLKAQVNDAQMWASVAIEKTFFKKLTISLTEEIRLNENITEMGVFFTDVGLSYKFHKNWRISGNYRIINKRRLDNSYSTRHRYYFDLAYRKKWYSFTLIIRSRFQSQYTDVNNSETGKIPDYYSRNKLTLKYGVTKKISPYTSAELFIPLNNKERQGIDNFRFSTGLEFEFLKNSVIDIFYMYQKEFQVANPERDHIIGVGYTFSF